MQQEFADARAERATDREAINRIVTTLDGIASRLDTDESERMAANAQLDRHEEWIERAATKLKVKYDASA